MTLKILVVEDSPEYQLMIRGALGSAMNMDFCSTLQEARTRTSQSVYDLVLLDVTMPDGNGFEFCSELQRNEKTKKVLVIFLTGHSSTADKVMGLNLGAEDYITKPFDPIELKARIDNKLRKNILLSQEDASFERGPLKMHLPTYSAYMRDQGQEMKLDLTPIEYKILYRLAKNPNQILSRQQLIDGVWGNGAFIEDRSVDKHISSLRKKMGETATTIRTVSGLGYQFVSDRH